MSGLSADHRMIQQMIRDFASRELRTQAREWDAAEQFPKEAIAKLGALGMLGIRAPEEHGGAGLDALACAIVMEELGRGDGSVAITASAHNGLVVGHLLLAGTDAQKTELLPRLASGEWLGAWALTEAHAGSDAAALSTRAERRGDAWVLNGAKAFVSQGSVARLCVVMARSGEGKDGITAFVVDTQSPGYRVARRVEKLGMRASDTVDIALDAVVVPDGMRLGPVGRGFRDAMELITPARVNLAAVAIGIARGALEASAVYANERRQFDVPIGSFQMIQWKLANAATELDAARLLVHRAALLIDAGRPCRKEAAMAKLFASEAAVRACNDAIQIHGGYGYTTEFPVERAWRDAKLTTIGEGTSEILRLVIARDVLSALD